MAKIKTVISLCYISAYNKYSRTAYFNEFQSGISCFIYEPF